MTFILQCFTGGVLGWVISQVLFPPREIPSAAEIEMQREEREKRAAMSPRWTSVKKQLPGVFRELTVLILFIVVVRYFA